MFYGWTCKLKRFRAGGKWDTRSQQPAHAAKLPMVSKPTPHMLATCCNPLTPPPGILNTNWWHQAPLAVQAQRLQQGLRAGSPDIFLCVLTHKFETLGTLMFAPCSPSSPIKLDGTHFFFGFSCKCKCVGRDWGRMRRPSSIHGPRYHVWWLFDNCKLQVREFCMYVPCIV
jgi:hypothetical protein